MAPKPRKPAAGAPASPALARARPAAAPAPAAPQPQAAAPELEAQPAPSPPAAVAAEPQHNTTPAPELEAQPQPQAEAAGPAQAQPKRKGKSKGKRWKPPGPFTPPPVALPGSADELLALELPEVERLQAACEMRLGHLKAKRARWLKDAEPPAQKLAELAAEAAELGGTLGALNRRRTALRVARRQALGSIPERAEAIAVAVDRVLWGSVLAAVMAEADRIQATAARDLAADAPQQT